MKGQLPQGTERWTRGRAQRLLCVFNEEKSQVFIICYQDLVLALPLTSSSMVFKKGGSPTSDVASVISGSYFGRVTMVIGKKLSTSLT